MSDKIDAVRAWKLIEAHLANLRFERVVDYPMGEGENSRTGENE